MVYIKNIVFSKNCTNSCLNTSQVKTRLQNIKYARAQSRGRGLSIKHKWEEYLSRTVRPTCKITVFIYSNIEFWSNNFLQKYSTQISISLQGEY